MIRTSRPRLALLATVAGMAVALASAAPAQATDGGCSPASAPVISAGATETSNPGACTGGAEYWAMSLQVGDTLTVDGSPTAGSGVGYMSLDIDGPNVQTIGQPLCNNDDNYSAFSETCVIPATGTYLLVSDAGSGQFTPTVSTAGGGSGRAAGQCSSSAAPSAPAGVTQYTNSQLCQGLGGNQYWAMNLQVGETLSVNGVPIPSSGGASYMSLDIYGPNVQTIGQPLCNNDDNYSAFSETCVIPATGTYLLVSDAGSGRFTPRVDHPLLAALQRAYSHWSPFGHTSVVRVQASSPRAASVCVLIAAGMADAVPAAVLRSSASRGPRHGPTRVRPRRQRPDRRPVCRPRPAPAVRQALSQADADNDLRAARTPDGGRRHARAVPPALVVRPGAARSPRAGAGSKRPDAWLSPGGGARSGRDTVEHRQTELSDEARYRAEARNGGCPLMASSRVKFESGGNRAIRVTYTSSSFAGGSSSFTRAPAERRALGPAR